MLTKDETRKQGRSDPHFAIALDCGWSTGTQDLQGIGGS